MYRLIDGISTIKTPLYLNESQWSIFPEHLKYLYEKI